MYEVMPESSDDVLAIRVSGKLSTADLGRLRGWLRERLAQSRCPALLVLMEDFSGWEGLGALVDDAKLDVEVQDDVGRVAMVGERAWQKWMTRIAAPFFKAEVRYFERSELPAARHWARTGEGGGGS